jgi:hypothetical protein
VLRAVVGHHLRRRPERLGRRRVGSVRLHVDKRSVRPGVDRAVTNRRARVEWR